MDNKDGGMVADTLQYVVNKEELLDTSDCEGALAAAEVVAALAGRPSEDFPEDPLDNLESLQLLATPALRKLAVAAVGKIKEGSELQQYWAEQGELESWNGVLDNLIGRLA